MPHAPHRDGGHRLAAHRAAGHARRAEQEQRAKINVDRLQKEQCFDRDRQRAGPRRLAPYVEDVRARAVRQGRRPEDILFFQGVTPVVGGTEAETNAKEAEYLELSSTRGAWRI